MAIHRTDHDMVVAADMQPQFAPHVFGGYAVPANDNLKLKADDLSPLEALLTVARIKQRLLRENRETHSLMVSATRRKIWDELVACENCLRWKYFR